MEVRRRLDDRILKRDLSLRPLKHGAIDNDIRLFPRGIEEVAAAHESTILPPRKPSS